MAAIVGVAILASCSSHHSSASAPTTIAPPTSASAAGPADLRHALFDQLPASYVEEPAGTGVDGPLALPAAAKAQSSANPSGARSQLVTLGFKRGYARGWVVTGASEFLYSYVFLFDSPHDATSYWNQITFEYRVDPNISTFPTGALANAASFIVHTTAQGVHDDYVVDLVAGPLFYRVDLGGPPGSVTPSDVLTIARSQMVEAAALGYS